MIKLPGQSLLEDLCDLLKKKHLTSIASRSIIYSANSCCLQHELIQMLLHIIRAGSYHNKTFIHVDPDLTLVF